MGLSTADSKQVLCRVILFKVLSLGLLWSLWLTNTTWVWPKTSRTKFTSNHRIQSTRSNSRSWRHTANLADKLWMNGWNWELSRGPNSLYNSPIFCVPKKQGQRLQIIQDFWELNQIEVGECNTVVKRISNCLSMKPCSTGKPCCQL